MNKKEFAISRICGAASTFYDMAKVEQETPESEFYRRSALLLYSLATSIETDGKYPITNRAKEFEHAANLLKDLI